MRTVIAEFNGVQIVETPAQELESGDVVCKANGGGAYQVIETRPDTHYKLAHDVHFWVSVRWPDGGETLRVWCKDRATQVLRVVRRIDTGR